jgi:hypothetical protein
MTVWHEHAKGADRPQRFHQIGRQLAAGFDLSCACGEVGRQSPDIGEQGLGWVCHERSDQAGHFLAWMLESCSRNLR